jgi:hypothetical protein
MKAQDLRDTICAVGEIQRLEAVLANLLQFAVSQARAVKEAHAVGAQARCYRLDYPLASQPLVKPVAGVLDILRLRSGEFDQKIVISQSRDEFADPRPPLIKAVVVDHVHGHAVTQKGR